MNIKQETIDSNIGNPTEIPPHTSVDTVNDANADNLSIKQEVTEDVKDVCKFAEVTIKQEVVDIKVEDCEEPKPKDANGNGPSWTESGKKQGTHIYTDRTHYKYIEHSRSQYKRQLRCAKFESGCLGRASMDLEPLGKPLVLLRDHTCTPEINGTAEFRNILKSRALNESTSFERIWTEECRRKPDMVSGISRAKMFDLMRRARRMRQPPKPPQSLREMGEMLASPAWASRLLHCHATEIPFFRGSLEIQHKEGQTEFVGLVFANHDFWGKNQPWLIRQEEIQLVIDGTFEILPKLDGLSHLLAMHMIVDHLAIPIGFFLLKNRNKETYIRVLKYIRHEMPLPINYSSASITIDYEQGLHDALINIFPECGSADGCWLQYNKSLVRWIKDHNLEESMQSNASCRRILRLITAIPHLPAATTEGFPQNFTVRGGLDIVKQLVDYLELQEIFTAFFEYYERFWMEEVGAERLTAYCRTLITNNFLESYHGHLLRLMGPDPAVWTFYERLRDIEKKMRDDASKMLNGEVVRRKIINCKNGNKKIIATALREVRDNNLATYGFLLKVGHCVDTYLQDAFGKINDNDDDLFNEADEQSRQAAIALLLNEEVPKQRRGSGRIRGKSSRREREEETPEVDEEPPTEEVAQKRARGDRCTVCLDQQSIMAVIPCGHLCICQECSERLLQSGDVVCPVCRSPGENIIRIFMNI